MQSERLLRLLAAGIMLFFFRLVPAAHRIMSNVESATSVEPPANQLAAYPPISQCCASLSLCGDKGFLWVVHGYTRNDLTCFWKPCQRENTDAMRSVAFLALIPARILVEEAQPRIQSHRAACARDFRAQQLQTKLSYGNPLKSWQFCWAKVLNQPEHSERNKLCLEL